MAADQVDQILQTACQLGDLNNAYLMVKSSSLPITAARLHIQSALELILFANAEVAVSLHREGKRLDSSQLPPLAKLHLDGQSCGGLSDIFYIAAVSIKQLVDNSISHEIHLNTLTTMITLTSDSGLHHASEAHYEKALSIMSTNESTSDASIFFRGALLTPGVYESMDHLTKTRQLLFHRVEDLYQHRQVLTLPKLDEFTLSPTFYFVYQGWNDRELLTKLHAAYGVAHSPLREVLIAGREPRNRIDNNQTNRIRVGFVSAHFRRHSICKLFCGIILGLDRSIFEVYVFSALQEPYEDELTLALRKGTHFIRIGQTLVQNRREVVDRNIDILVYLDVGMVSVKQSSDLSFLIRCLFVY